MGKLVALTGNIAVATAMKQINPDVCAAYPITPATQVMEQFSEYVADGLVDTELIATESEHSAMSACIGGSSRRQGDDINIIAGPCIDVGDAIHSSRHEVSYNACMC